MAASCSAIEPGSLNPDSNANGLAEIDTSTLFVSVREAANRFGGFGFWRPDNCKPPEAVQVSPSQDNFKEGDIMELKTQAAKLQNDLILKEHETHEVLKELEATKATVIELNSKLQQKNEKSLREEVHGYIKPAGVVLKDLNQAKMNLCKRTVILRVYAGLLMS